MVNTAYGEYDIYSTMQYLLSKNQKIVSYHKRINRIVNQNVYLFLKCILLQFLELG